MGAFALEEAVKNVLLVLLPDSRAVVVNGKKDSLFLPDKLHADEAALGVKFDGVA